MGNFLVTFASNKDFEVSFLFFNVNSIQSNLYIDLKLSFVGEGPRGKSIL